MLKSHLDMKSKFYYTAIATCCAVLLILWVYSPFKVLGFASVDDHWSVLHNPLVFDTGFTTSYFSTLAVSYNSIQYSPLNTFYYNLIARINGFDPYYFHLGSLIVHVLNTYLFFVIAKKILTIFNKTENVLQISFICAAVWAIHPLNVEAVAWIAASKIVLSTLFTLLSLYAFLRYMQTNKQQYLLYNIIYFILAFLCKEQVIVNPLMFLCIKLIIDYHRNRRITFKREEILYFICSLILLVVFCLITLNASASRGSNSLSSYPLSQRFFLGFYCLFFYSSNLLLPVNLHYHYPFPMKAGEALPVFYYMFFPLFTFIAYIAFKYKVFIKGLQPFTILCWTCAIIQISLCLQFLPLKRPAMVAERYMYIPSFFILLLIISTLADHVKRKNIQLYLAITIPYILYLAVYSNLLVEKWTSLTFRIK